MNNTTQVKPSNSSRFDTRIHIKQISNFLPLLNNKAIDLINKSQEVADNPLGKGQYTNEFHFDNNKLWEASKRINENYNAALEAFPTKPDDIFVYFGQITHALQDFYSHSNWHELSLAGFMGDQRLLDEGYGLFVELRPLSRIGATKVVALEKGFTDPVTNWGRIDAWQVNPSSYVVSTKTDTGETIGGLMSGEVNGLLYGAGNSVEIIDPVTNKRYPGFDHGGLAGTISSKYLGPLAKDKATDRYHLTVLELARDQVQHELIRMLSLIQKRFGNEGLQKFSDLYIRDDLQDEFRQLIIDGNLKRKQLKNCAGLNTANDNQGDDAILEPFFKTSDPDVKVSADSKEVPKELKAYEEQILEGDFRWISDQPISLGGAPDSAILQVRVDGQWQTTDFTGSDLASYL